jgi:hypothetical protein
MTLRRDLDRATLVGIMRTHCKQLGIRDRHAHCMCGWVSTVSGGWGEHQGHVADVILAAFIVAPDPVPDDIDGFGYV